MADVKVIDHGLNAAIKALEKLDGQGVKVGIQGGTDSQDGVDLVDIAIFNELGTATIPARPFMAQTVAKHGEETHSVMEHLAKKVQHGQASANLAVSTLGEFYQAKVQAEMRSGDFVPNAPSTIRKKGSSVPLIDKGKLMQAVRYEKLK